jgi:hypothetical protein
MRAAPIRSISGSMKYSIDCFALFLSECGRSGSGEACQRLGGPLVTGSSGIAVITALLAPRYRRRLLMTGRWVEAVEGAPVIQIHHGGVKMSKLLSMLVAAVFAVSTVSVFAADAAAPAEKKEEMKKAEKKPAKKAHKAKAKKEMKKEEKKEEMKK